jgi:WD40 repeat protein
LNVVEAQAKEFHSVRHNFICQGCGKAPSTQWKTLDIPSRRVPQSKPSTSSHVGSESQQTLNTSRPQSLPHSTSKHADDIMIFAHSRASPLRQTSASTEQSKWSITANKHVEKELDVEIAHTFIHGETTVWCVKFSQDGKSLAAGCNDGKAYIYDVQTGTLSR